MVQFAPAARGPPQFWVSPKSPLSAPPRVIPLMVSAAVPVLVTVTLWGTLAVFRPWAAKIRLGGESPTTGAARPRPANGTACGLFVALSVRVRVPYRLPVVVGVNVTLTTQLAAAARLAGQLLV